MEQKLKSEETQSLILESAFSLFYENGYNATSIPEIVKKAGMSKGAFYHHFKDKQEVGEKTVSYLLRKRIYNGMVAPLAEKNNMPTVPFLVDLFSKRINGFPEEERKKGCPLNNLLNEVGYAEVSLKVRLKKIIEEWKKALMEFLKNGQQKGEIRKVIDLESTAVYLISAFEGARGIAKLYDGKEILEQYLKGVVTYIKQLE